MTTPDPKAPEFLHTFVPASPGWQAVYVGENGTAVYKDIAFWSVPIQGEPEAWVGNVGGLRPARGSFGNFLGIKGPTEDTNQWNQTVASVHTASQKQINLMEESTQSEDRLRYKGTVSGVDAQGVQILPDGGGPVQVERDFGVSPELAELGAGTRVQVLDTPSGMLLTPDSE